MNKINFIFMKIKMFITSYLFLYVLVLVLQVKNYPITFSKTNIDMKATVFATIISIFILVSIISTVDLLTTKGNESYKYESIERTGDSVISYMMTYIVPLLSESFLSYNGLVINSTLFLLIGIMYVKLDLVYFNPTWIILGYAVYVTNSGDLVISNIPYSTLKQNIGNSLKRSYLVKGIYLIQKKDNLKVC